MNTQSRNPQLGSLFELLVSSPTLTDVQIAKRLEIDLVPLRARLSDLRWRGILQHPAKAENELPGLVWKPWFSTAEGALEAAVRSGLRRDTTAVASPSWWRTISAWFFAPSAPTPYSPV